MLALARRTYTSRSYVNGNDWSFDSLQAARLGLGSEVKNDLLASIRSYQAYPSGLASFTGSAAQEPYVEQLGVLASTVAEGFVQDYDGLLGIAPAWPGDWTAAAAPPCWARNPTRSSASPRSPATRTSSS